MCSLKGKIYEAEQAMEAKLLYRYISLLELLERIKVNLS
jgi:hypothetical protein